MRILAVFSFCLWSFCLWSFSLWIGLAGLLAPQALGQSCVAVTTYHNDNFRTGQNLAETVITPTTISTLKPRFTSPGVLDSWSVAQPLFLPQTPINGGVHNVVFVATLNNSVYAFDGDTGAQYWYYHSGPPDSTPFQATTGCTDSGFGKSPGGGAGIVGTPVIDMSISPPAMYFVTKEFDGTNHTLKLHAVDTSSGLELCLTCTVPSPIVLQASVVNKAGKTITLSSSVEYQMSRPGMLLSNGTIYLAVGSVGCRQYPAYGWVMSYTFSLTNGFTQQAVFNTTPDLANPNGISGPYGNGGIWQGGGGLAADASGNIYFETADANNFYLNSKGWQGSDFGDSIVQLTPSLGAPASSANFFTPFNDHFLYQYDLDLGSTGPVLLPDQTQGGTVPTHVLIGYGKAEEIYVINRDNMGGYTTNGPNAIVQDVPDPGTGGCSTGTTKFTQCANQKGTCGFGAPAYWNNNIYFASGPGPLMSYAWNPSTTTIPPTPLAACPTVEGGFSSGAYAYAASPSISSNGTSGGLLWVITWPGTRQGMLRAFDATNLGSQLFEYTVGSVAGYPTPTIANGNVYVATKARLYSFGIKGVSGCKAAGKATESSIEARPVSADENRRPSK